MRNKRLKKAYDYLRSLGKVHTQKEIAAIMNVSEETVSRSFNGKANFPSDNFLIDFNRSFGMLFSDDWLLTGEGGMLAKEKPTKEGDKMDVSVTIQILSNTVNLLQNELQNVRQELRELKADVAKLQRAKTGYGPMVAAEDAQHYGIKESNF